MSSIGFYDYVKEGVVSDLKEHKLARKQFEDMNPEQVRDYLDRNFGWRTHPIRRAAIVLNVARSADFINYHAAREVYEKGQRLELVI